MVNVVFCCYLMIRDIQLLMRGSVDVDGIELELTFDVPMASEPLARYRMIEIG